MVDEVCAQQIWVEFEFDERIRGEVLLGVVPEPMRAACTDVKVNTKRGKRYREVRGPLSVAVEEWNDRDARQFTLSDPVDDSAGLFHMIVTKFHDGTRLSFSFCNSDWSGSVFDEIRGLFVSVVERLSPRWGIGGVWLSAKPFSSLLGNLWSDNMHLYTAPRYDWLQVYRPGEFIDVAALDGSGCEFMQIGDCRVILSGPTPVVSLARRDAIRAALLKGLPIGEHLTPPGTVPQWESEAVLGTEEGGVELSDELQVLTGPLEP